jgi:hypothetical protein
MDRPRRPDAERRMSTEPKNAGQSEVGARLGGMWNDFKQGKVIGYKWMAIILIVVSTIGVLWYIVSERRSAASHRWVEEEEANTIEKQEEISKKYPGTMLDKLARLQIARSLLGESGLDQLGANTSEQRTKGVANIEKAREMFQKLADDFKDDRLFKAECYLALAKSEAALVAVPTTPGQLTEFKGKIPAVVEYLDKLAETAAPETPWAKDSKKLADSLRNEQSPSADEFRRVQRALFDLKTPELPKFDDPRSPLGGIGGPVLPNIPGLPR